MLEKQENDDERPGKERDCFLERYQGDVTARSKEDKQGKGME